MTTIPFSRLLIAVLAAAALAVAASPGSRAAGPPQQARFSLTVDGVEIASFTGYAVSESGAMLNWVVGSPALRSWAVSQKRADPEVVMFSAAGTPVARWRLDDAWVAKIQPGSGEVAIESITLVHEGFEIA